MKLKQQKHKLIKCEFMYTNLIKKNSEVVVCWARGRESVWQQPSRRITVYTNEKNKKIKQS